MPRTDPTDTGGLFVGRRPGTKPVKYRTAPQESKGGRRRFDALLAAALWLLVSEREHVCTALHARDLLPAALAALAAAAMGASWGIDSRWAGLLLALLLAGGVLGVAWLASPGLRKALRR